MPTIKELSFALLKSWNHDTAHGEWIEDIPDLNQCCVTALVVQDYYGGDILMCKLNKGYHYWNLTDYCGELDLTFTQFAYSKLYPKTEPYIKNRKRLLYIDDVKRRYLILKERVEENLNDKNIDS